MEQTQQEKISLINGRIHTRSGTAKNITFENGRIVSIDDDSGSFSGKVIDLHGRTVLPGFVDSGINFLSWAENQERLNLSRIKSTKDFKDALNAYFHANNKPLRGWYIAYNLSDSVTISRDDIEEVIGALPCAVIDEKNTHIILNTPAMNELNMPQDNVEPDEFIQHLPGLTLDEIKYLADTYSAKISSLGISEIAVDFRNSSLDLWDVFSKEIYESLNFRLRCNFGFDDVGLLNNFLASGLRTNDGLPFCKIGGIFVKGELEQQEQKNMIYSAHLSGCQVISDNNKSCLNALERVVKKVHKNSRHLVKNFTGGALIERMKLLNLGGIALSDVDADFIHEGFQNGVVISGASGENLTAPLKNIGRLVTDGLSVAEALSVYTWGAAWNFNNELRRGELAVGNDADVIVLEQDPFLVRPEEISLIDVTMTFCAGNTVYASGAL
ncbi:MAG: amidohydrolase family protein [Synergistaceae bacterium]|nr:amidohydrolase family protein [Synergistaceae bacterium]